MTILNEQKRVFCQMMEALYEQYPIQGASKNVRKTRGREKTKDARRLLVIANSPTDPANKFDTMRQQACPRVYYLFTHVIGGKVGLHEGYLRQVAERVKVPVNVIVRAWNLCNPAR